MGNVRTSGKAGREPSWTKSAKLSRVDGERLAANVANALAALRNDTDLRGAIGFDEMKRAAVFRRPWRDRPALKRVTDNDATAMQEHLQLSGLPRIGKDAVFQAIQSVAVENAFHPVRDYLDALSWDGVCRLDEWLSLYLGAAPTIYHAEIGSMFMVGAVRRIYEPGCQMDYALVLEGKQGGGKSTACKILGDAWFSDSLPTLRFGDKEPSAHLRGKWFVEIAELSAFKGADAAALKSFITRRDEQFRPAFGRLEVHEPRQCVFIATTNERAYLNDPTGSRRFWPVECGAIDLDALKRDRDQLFAEAVFLYHEGVQNYPDREFEQKHIAPVQAARQDVDPWEEEIGSYLLDRSTVLVGDIMRDCLRLENARSTATNRRVTGILARLGWSRSETKTGGYYPWRPQTQATPRGMIAEQVAA